MSVQERAEPTGQRDRYPTKNRIIPTGGFIPVSDKPGFPNIIFKVFNLFLDGPKSELKTTQAFIGNRGPPEMQGQPALTRVPLRAFQLLQLFPRQPRKAHMDGPVLV